jgi:hypothetical protein
MKLIPPRNPKTEGDHLEIGRLEFLASSYEHNEHPRDAAVRHLRETIAAGRAGLDPYDETIFLLDATPNEIVWAGAVVNLTGLLLDVTGAPEKGGRRYRMILEADVRDELGLDAPDAPVVDDEPLASRRTDPRRRGRRASPARPRSPTRTRPSCTRSPTRATRSSAPTKGRCTDDRYRPRPAHPADGRADRSPAVPRAGRSRCSPTRCLCAGSCRSRRPRSGRTPTSCEADQTSLFALDRPVRPGRPHPRRPRSRARPLQGQGLVPADDRRPAQERSPSTAGRSRPGSCSRTTSSSTARSRSTLRTRPVRPGGPAATGSPPTRSRRTVTGAAADRPRPRRDREAAREGSDRKVWNEWPDAMWEKSAGHAIFRDPEVRARPDARPRRRPRARRRRPSSSTAPTGRPSPLVRSPPRRPIRPSPQPSPWTRARTPAKKPGRPSPRQPLLPRARLLGATTIRSRSPPGPPPAPTEVPAGQWKGKTLADVAGDESGREWLAWALTQPGPLQRALLHGPHQLRRGRPARAVGRPHRTAGGMSAEDTVPGRSSADGTPSGWLRLAGGDPRRTRSCGSTSQRRRVRSGRGEPVLLAGGVGSRRAVSSSTSPSARPRPSSGICRAGRSSSPRSRTRSSKRDVKLLAFGDLHLGAGTALGREPGDRLRDQEQVLERIIALAGVRQVDAILMAATCSKGPASRRSSSTRSCAPSSSSKGRSR